MHTPTIETLSAVPHHLRWFEEGLPYPVRLKTNNELLEHDDLETAVLRQEFYCQAFDLLDQDQLAKYVMIRQRAIDGWYEILDIRRLEDEAHRTPKVWVEWLQNYWEVRHDD